MLLQKADIVMLNETWTTKANQMSELQTDSHNVVAVSSDKNRDYGHEDGKAGRGHGGVAICARKEIELVPVGAHEDTRIVPVLVRTKNIDILLIAAYLPTGTLREKSIEYQETVDRICTVIQQHGEKRLVLVGGDLNVDLTKEVHGNKKHILSMMKECNLIVPCACLEGKATFYNNEVTPVSLLDYFLIGQEHAGIVQEYIVQDRSALNRSDHEPVTIKIAICDTARPSKNRREKIDWVKSKKRGKIDEYCMKIAHDMRGAKNVEDIVTNMLQADKVLPRRGKLKKSSQWWDAELTQLRRRCLAAKQRWRKAEGECKYDAEREYRIGKRKYMDAQRKGRLCRQIQEDNNLEEECKRLSATFFKVMKHGKNNRSINRIKVQEREMFQPCQIAEEFLHHFVRVGQRLDSDNFQAAWEEVVTGVVEATCSRYERKLPQLEPIGRITRNEVTDALKALKRDKAPGFDNLTPEHLIEARGLASQAIADCFEDIVHTTSIPDNFKYGLITPVFKGHGADPASTDSYRDITVQTMLCKVFEKILDRRLRDELRCANVPSDLQFAYRRDRGTLQANFILQEVIAANMDLGRAVYVAFLDVKKCFNSIWHDGLLYKLISAGVSPRIILTLRNLYRECHVKVKVHGEQSAHGRIEQGLKQGGVLSTTLLTLFMDDKIRQVQKEEVGAEIGHKRIGIIAYADDEVLVSTDPTELQRLLNIAHQHSCLWRYRYNAAKCKILIYGRARDTDISWKLGNEQLEVTDQYTHLGVIMAPKAASKRRIEEGMKKARRALYAHCTQGLNIARMSPLTMYLIWRVYAEPALTYSLAVTKMTVDDMTHLERMQLRIYRQLQGLPARVQKAVVYAMLGAPPCRILIMRVAMQFLGFLLRAARSHDITHYVLLHGAVNQDREGSLARQWEVMLAELGLPALTELILRYTTRREGGWTREASAALEQLAEADLRDSTERLTSIRWLGRLLPLGGLGKPPERFWPTSRYSSIGRQATLTRIKLLAGHSWVAGGIARRHTRTGASCPLCCESEETLEHFLYECAELRQAREDVERKTGVLLPRKREAEAFLLEADLAESQLIHRLYAARIERELSVSPNPASNSLRPTKPKPRAKYRVRPILASSDR